MVAGKIAVMEGSWAVAEAVKACRPAVIAAYPITPQTHIIESLALMVSKGELDTEFIRADSEFSAASIITGASAGGVRAYTASSSQGLLLMTEVIYYLAGSRLPVVFTGANRQVSAPIGLQPDHQDTMSLRDTGMIQLYVESAQEAYDTHIQAFKIAEDHQVLLPTMVCMDGFVLTHVYEPVKIFEQAAIDAFLPAYDPLYYLSPDKPMIFGSHVDENNALEFRYMTHQANSKAKEKVEAAAQQYRAIFGDDHYLGGLIDTYYHDDAEVLLVAMGSTVSTLREVVDVLRSEGMKVGLVKIRCFRPFPAQALRQAVGKAGAVVVLDRSISMGHQGVLSLDVKSALYPLPHHPLVLGLMAGYGGREVTLESTRAMVEKVRRALQSGAPSTSSGSYPAAELAEAELADVEFIGLKPELIPPEFEATR